MTYPAGIVLYDAEKYCLQQAARQAVGHHTPRGGDGMPITITLHVFGFTITVRVNRKSDNRHSAK